MKWTLLLIVSLISAACSQTPEKEGSQEFAIEQSRIVQQFERGNKLLDENNAAEAAKVYDSLIVDKPVSQLDLLILFNSGLAHYQNNDCEVASDRLRKVIRLASRNSPIIKSRALLRMSDVYTCLGQDNKAITNLIEIFVNKGTLPSEIARAEVPAKLAAAYARIGNGKEAEKYFRIAEKGLLQVQSEYQKSAERVDALARTLFMMGNLNQINVQTMSPDDYFATLYALQKYLYKSVEFDSKVWSVKSFDEIDKAYENTWAYIDKVKASENPDKSLSEREKQIEQLRVAQLGLQSIRQFYQNRIPDPDESALITALVRRVKGHENKLRNYIATNVVGTSLTPEALEAEGLKRAGRVLNPDPLFEKQLLQKTSPKTKVKKKK